MKKYIILPMLLCAIGLTANSCMEKKYKYDVEVTSADGYRCLISWRGCYFGKGTVPFSASGSWGRGNASMVSGPDMKPLPDTLCLLYYSTTEDQFYRLKAAVNREKIRPLLEGRYKQKDYDDAYFYTFSIGIAPCGFVSLWLVGSAGQVLIDTFHAQKTDEEYHWAFPTDGCTRQEALEIRLEYLYPFVLKEIKEKRISSKYWESLNNSYEWKLKFSDPGFSLYNYDIYLLNQENRMYLTDPAWPVVEGKKFIPVELTICLKHKLDPIKYEVVIKLRKTEITYERDEEEETTVLKYMNKSRALLRFFDAFYQKAGNNEVNIYVDFDNSMKSLKLKLKTADYEEEFPAYEYKIYDSETYNLD